MRHVIGDLIDPQKRRQQEDRDQLGEMRRQMEATRKKVDEVEFMQQKAQKKTASSEELARGMAAIEVRLKQLEAKMSEQIQDAHDGVDELKVKVV